MENKSFNFELKEIDDSGQFEGYASVFDVIDHGNDVVEKGAFKKTLQEKKEFPILYYHDPREVLGIIEASEDQKGLKVLGKLNLNVQRAREVYELLKQKAIKGLSIGYDTIKQAWDKDIRRLKELKLWEISLVTFPMNEAATVTAVKAVVPYQDLPLADINTKWDDDAAKARVRNWAGGPDKEKIDWGKYRKAFLWYDEENPEKYESYKLPIADVIDGQLRAVPRGIFAAAAAIQGARGGVKIPDTDKEKIKKHLEKYYKRLDREPPWQKGEYPIEEILSSLICETKELKAGRVISSTNLKLIKQAIEALNALLEAAEPSDDDTQGDKKSQDKPDKPVNVDHLLDETIKELKKLKSFRKEE